MIVRMSRVTILGPRRLQAAVTAAVQTLGVLHVDHVRSTEDGIAPRALSAEHQAARDAIDGVRTRAEAILTLLPPLETSPVPTAPYAEQSPDVLRPQLEGLEAGVKDLTRRLLEAEEEMEILRAYGRAIEVLAPLLMVLEGSRSLETIGFVMETKPAGALDSLRAELASATHGRVELVSRPVDDHHLGAVVAFARQDAEGVRTALTRGGVTELRLPASVRDRPLGEAVPYLQARVQALPGEIEGLRQGLMQLSGRHLAEVGAIATVARDAVHRFELMAQTPQSRYAFILYGWVPTGRVAAVRDGLRNQFGREIVVYDEPAPVHHAESVPVVLENPPWLKPFELFLAIFDPPKYGTFDPTIFFALTMPLWVGLIIGDIGYGLFLLAITLALRAKARAGRPWRVVLAGMDFGFTMTPTAMRRVVALLSWMTVSTFVFGVIYGEFFGNLPQRLFPGFHPLFNREEELKTYLYLSIGFGLAQVYLGLFMEIIKAVRHRHRAEFLETIALATGAMTVFLWLATQAHELPAAVFQPVMLVSAVAFVLSLFLSASLGSWIWIMETISTFGAIVSYARIFAVGIAALALAIVANTLASGHGGGIAAFVIGLVIGTVAHVMFFGLTIISHVLQPARLNWVEFFSKFKYYQDTGHPYRPFQRTGGGT